MTDNGDSEWENENGRRAGLQAAYDAINKWIKTGPLPPEEHAQRNGLVLAANEVRNLMDGQ